MTFFGEGALRNAVRQYLEHYHSERNHQSLGNRLIEPDHDVGAVTRTVECRERLGGLLKVYHRQAT